MHRDFFFGVDKPSVSLETTYLIRNSPGVRGDLIVSNPHKHADTMAMPTLGTRTEEECAKQATTN